MKPSTVLALSPLIVCSLLAADATEALKTAAKKLADQSYSWTATTKLEGVQWNPGPTQGKTEKDGYTCLSQELNDQTVEAVVKGDKCAVKTDEGWKLPDEVGQGAQGGFNPARMIGRLAATMKKPAEEVLNLADKTKALSAGDAGVLAGDLTEEGAKDVLLMGRRGRPGGNPPAAPKDAKGSVKFWLKDGALVKYEVRVQGKVTTGQDQQEREIVRTTTVELKDVGTTKVTVPEEAKKKLTS